MRRLAAATLLIAAGQAHAKASAKATTDARPYGVGGGLAILYPPMPTVEGRWQPHKSVNVGVEAGYMTVPLKQFSGTATYVGVDGRFLVGTSGLFGALALGRRTFDITTKNRFTVNDVDNQLSWRRVVSQTILYPKAGWQRLGKDGHAFAVAAGVVVPSGTSFSISHDPETVEGGLPAEQLAQEESERADDVKKVTNATMVSVELKYTYYFPSGK